MPVEDVEDIAVDVGAEHDEHRRDQHQGDVLLEAAHLPHARQIHIAHPQAHHRDRKQTGLVLHVIGKGVDHQHRSQGARRFQVFRDRTVVEGPPQQPGCATTQTDARTQGNQQARQQTAVAGLIAEHEHLENQHGGQRTDGVVDDPFPFEIRRGASVQMRLPQQRHDHGRPGHHNDRAEHHRHR